MDNISDNNLIEALIDARKYKLADDFIAIIEEEIKKRGLNIDSIELYQDDFT